MPGAVVWASVSTGGDVRVLPDGCIDLLWDGVQLTVAGPDTLAHVHVSPAGAPLWGLRLAPGTGPRVVGIPAGELTNRRVPADALWDAHRVERATDALTAGGAPGRTLEDLALGWCTPPDAATAMVEHVATLAGRGLESTAIADSIGLSARQLQRRSVAAFGYGPKTLGRILRMQRAIALVRQGGRPATVAAHLGFADQAHLARDVKAMAGVPLGRLLS